MRTRGACREVGPETTGDKGGWACLYRSTLVPMYLVLHGADVPHPEMRRRAPTTTGHAGDIAACSWLLLATDSEMASLDILVMLWHFHSAP